MSGLPVRLDQRVDDLGEGAERLVSLLYNNIVPHFNPQLLSMFSDFSSKPTTTQWAFVRILSRNNEVPQLFDPVLAAALVSLIECRYPIQLDISDSVFVSLLHLCVPLFNSLSTQVGHGDGNTKTILDHISSGTPLFPLKSHPGASNKVNVYCSEVFIDCSRHFPLVAQRFSDFYSSIHDLFDDQASAVLLFACSTSAYFADPVALAVAMIKDPKSAKLLSNCCKALGVNGTRLGSIVVEGNAMLGRAVGRLDLVAEGRSRCGTDASHMVVKYPPDVLRACIRQVLTEELNPRQVSVSDPDDFWTRRWLWGVNGAHSVLVERRDPKWRTVRVPKCPRTYRRQFLESCTTNPLHEWDGEVFVSASEKLEAGKTRLILACDTLSYVCFEHLLRPVENVWRNRNVILDPGAGGHAGIINRVLSLRKLAPISLMLDYSDFNSQHSLDGQATVIDELCALIDYPLHLRRRLVDSFNKMHIYAQGQFCGVAGATLMSGHRATTFVNSVLNRAYILCALPVSLRGSLSSLHVGDDVYIAARSLDEAALVLECMGDGRCTINPAKQSTGSERFEFLRIASDARNSFGYLCRVISSIISGNWHSESKLTPLEGLQTMIQGSRSLINRSGNINVYRCLVTSVARIARISRKVADELLSGRVALGTGPSFTRDFHRQYRPVVIDRTESEDVRQILERLPHNATSDYLSCHMSEVELLAQSLVKIDLVGPMKSAAYSKSLVEIAPVSTHLTIGAVSTHHTERVRSVETCFKARPVQGAFSPYPLLHLYRNSMTRRHKSELLSLILNRKVSVFEDLDVLAWGYEATGVVVHGWLSYSDASLYSTMADCDVLSTSRSYYI